MSELQQFLSQVQSAIQRRNGQQLSEQLSLPINHIVTNPRAPLPLACRSLVENARRVDVEQLCRGRLHQEHLSSAAAAYCACLSSIVDGDFFSAYKSSCTVYNSTLDYFSQRDEETTWMIPLLVRASNDLRCIAEKADEAAQETENKNLRESLNYLTKGFSTVARDRSGSKRMAIFAVTNVLFKIYFKTNTLQLCGKLINVVEGPGGVMDNLRAFPVCDVVMYKYYLGRLHMFEDRYQEARSCLRFALRHCPRSMLRNRQRILASLVPVEMCLGVMPSSTVATTYGLHEFFTLGQAVIRGDIAAFDAVMDACQSSFVRIGVFLVLEQVKMLAYRNLFRRIYLLVGNTRLNLLQFEAALRCGSSKSDNTAAEEEAVDLDEIECILTNLIYQNKIKGYISHQKRFLIVSKNDPFPKTAVIKKAN